MKKLFISLLRAGDFIMQRPLLASQTAEHEVHVLVNDEFQQLKALYPEFKFHFFPRQELQALINQPYTSLLKPFENLRKHMADLNEKHFDEIVNLTHNRLSAYLMDQLDATQVKRGLQFKDDHFLPLENEYQKYFNEVFSQNQKADAHYIAVLAKSLGMPIPRLHSAEDRSAKRIVYLQVLTSDEKKNWSLHKWMALVDKLKAQYPIYKFKILAAPFELEKLKGYFNPHDLEVTSLFEIKEKLKNSRMLITGDTSVAHLAAETRTPCLVLSLGSSDATKTSPWMFGAWVMTTTTTCAPCPHSSPCSQKIHLCGEDLKINSVMSVFNGIESDKQSFGLIAPAVLFRTEYDMHYVLKLKPYSPTGGFYDERSTSTSPVSADA